MTTFETKSVSRRVVLGGLAAGTALVAMPAVLRAQKLNWIGASATPPTDFIAQSLDFFAKRLGELTQGQITTWVDGALVPGLRADAEPTPDLDQQWYNKPDWKPTLVDIKFGWESYAGQTMVLHFDDLALAAAPIGCD